MKQRNLTLLFDGFDDAAHVYRDGAGMAPPEALCGATVDGMTEALLVDSSQAWCTCIDCMGIVETIACVPWCRDCGGDIHTGHTDTCGLRRVTRDDVSETTEGVSDGATE